MNLQELDLEIKNQNQKLIEVLQRGEIKKNEMEFMVLAKSISKLLDERDVKIMNN